MTRTRTTLAIIAAVGLTAYAAQDKAPGGFDDPPVQGILPEGWLKLPPLHQNESIRPKDQTGWGGWRNLPDNVVPRQMPLRNAEAEPLYGRLPPKKYDHPYKGRVIIERVNNYDDMSDKCDLFYGHNPVGCVASERHGVCRITIVSDAVAISLGYDPKILLRHEIGHCNGWRGHPGARVIGVEPAAEAALPQPEGFWQNLPESVLRGLGKPPAPPAEAPAPPAAEVPAQYRGLWCEATERPTSKTSSVTYLPLTKGHQRGLSTHPS